MITLVHTSDWHIGKAFSGFEPDVAGVLRQARLDGIDRIAGLAIAEGAAHVLIAGDSFDHSSLPDRLLRTVLSRLAATPQLTWHLIPGNHDPDAPGGIFDHETFSSFGFRCASAVSVKPVRMLFAMPPPYFDERGPMPLSITWADGIPTCEPTPYRIPAAACSADPPRVVGAGGLPG